jgi:hypothetical protein
MAHVVNVPLRAADWRRPYWRRFGPFACALLYAAERLELIRRLFFRGLTWDGDFPSRDCCTSLRDRGLAQYEFGFVWLTPEGVEIAIQELGLDREDMAA